MWSHRYPPDDYLTNASSPLHPHPIAMIVRWYKPSFGSLDISMLIPPCRQQSTILPTHASRYQLSVSLLVSLKILSDSIGRRQSKRNICSRSYPILHLRSPSSKCSWPLAPELNLLDLPRGLFHTVEKRGSHSDFHLTLWWDTRGSRRSGWSGW